MISVLGNRDFTAKAGNKGSFLHKMKEAGFNVPAGFVLDTDEYDRTVDKAGIAGSIKQATEGLCKDNVTEVSEKVKALFDGISPASDLTSFLEKDKLYAVRSSGTMEDLEGFSFAGQYDTSLNVKAEDVSAAVIECYKSQFSATVLSYLADNGLDVSDLKMSVVVQEMVDADFAGICFTLDPVTGDDKIMLIEAAEGLGEDIVSGRNKPEDYYYDWYEGKQVRINPENKLMTADKVTEAAKAFLDVALFFGVPCDIEFAVKDGVIYILQSRQITKINYSGIEDVWTTADFKDGGVSATVCTPYMWSLYEYIWEYSLRKFIVDSKILRDDELPRKLGNMYYGRCYWNLSAVKKTMSRIIGYREREFDNEYGIVGDYEGDGQVTGANPKTLARMLVIAQKQAALLKDRTENSERYKQELLDLYYGYKKAYDEKTADVKKDFYRLTHETYLRSETTYFWQIFINTIHQSMYKDSLLKYVSGSEYLTLLANIDNISHLLPFYDMWDITRKIRSDEDAFGYWKDNDASLIGEDLDKGIFFMPEVRKLIDDYGYHSDKELDVSYPCYSEEPETLISMVKDMALLDDSFSPSEDKERGKKEFDLIMAKLKPEVSSSSYKKIEKKVSKMRKMLWWREEYRDVSTRFYYMIRVYTVELSKLLVKEDVIAEEDDIWFLKVGDLWDYLDGKKTPADLKEIIRKNRVYYNAYRNYISENEIGHNFKAIADISDDKNALKGLGANNGRIRGVARVIEDFSEIERLKEGDILVTRFTDTGWTPKFAILSGIVTEYGGILCHAAIVSREYGIPAIVACKDAMAKIRDGDEIEMDGATGEVRILR